MAVRIPRKLFVLIFAMLCFALPASADVVKIVIDDTIHPITTEYIGRAIANAKATNAKAVLIELRTPGGLVDSTRDIVQEMNSSPVPVIVYVTPTGSRAASAGFFILQAADIAAMAPGTNTGAAHPVLGDGSKLDPIMKDKLENDAAAFMRSYVSKRGRNLELAESAVRQSKSWTDQEALSQKLIDVVAKDEKDLFAQIKDREFQRFDGSKVRLDLTAEPVRIYDMSLRMRILATLMNPNIAFLLFSLGMLAIYAEFNHPGAVVPGVVGVIAVLLALFALNILPTSYAAVAMILVAFALFAAEAHYATHGIAGIGGVLLMTLGAMLLVDGPIPEMRIKLWTALSISLPLGLITIFLMTIALRARRNKVTTGAEGMLGEIGIARTALAPSGKVFVHGELWDAVASVPIADGEEVTVEKVEGLKVHVSPRRRAESAVG